MFVQTLKLILYINVWFIHILRRQTAFLFHTDTIIERSYLRRDIVGTERELYTRSFRFLNDRFIRNMIKLVYLQSLSTFCQGIHETVDTLLCPKHIISVTHRVGKETGIHVHIDRLFQDRTDTVQHHIHICLLPIGAYAAPYDPETSWHR